MALTYTSNNVSIANSGAVNGTTTSGTLTIATDDVVVVMFAVEDNGNAGTLSISNSGTALSWTQIAVTTSAQNTKVGAWWAKSAGNENRTVSVNVLTSSLARTLCCRVHTGAHQTAPVPAGKAVFGGDGTDISRTITPTATGSALWMIAGDWTASNTFAPVANCTLDYTRHDAGFYTMTVVRPTTQPLTNATAFTIGETDGTPAPTNGTIAFLAFEVQAAPPAPDPYEISNLRVHPKYVMRGRPA